MTARLLLIARDGPSSQAYRDVLTQLAIAYDHVSSLSDIPDYILQTNYSGLLLDVPTSARAKRDEMEQIARLSEMFPILRLKWDAASKTIRTIYFGQTLDSAIDIATFATKYCASFQPRSINIDRRKKINFNVLLSRSSEFSKSETERANIVEISKQSCFVYTTEKWMHSETIWLRIMELDENDPIMGRVAWITHWGIPMQLPGVGVEFVSINSEMKQRIDNRIHPRQVSGW